MNEMIQGIIAGSLFMIAIAEFGSFLLMRKIMKKPKDKRSTGCINTATGTSTSKLEG